MDFQYQALFSFDRVPCLFLTTPLACIRSIVVLAYSYTTLLMTITQKNTCLLSFSKTLSMIIQLLIYTQATLLSPLGFLTSDSSFDNGDLSQRTQKATRQSYCSCTSCWSLSHEECTQHSCLLLCKARKKHNAGMPLFLGSEQHLLWALQLYLPC